MLEGDCSTKNDGISERKFRHKSPATINFIALVLLTTKKRLLKTLLCVTLKNDVLTILDVVFGFHWLIIKKNKFKPHKILKN